MVKDVQWLQLFMRDYNGVSLIPPVAWIALDVVLTMQLCDNRPNVHWRVQYTTKSDHLAAKFNVIKVNIQDFLQVF